MKKIGTNIEYFLAKLAGNDDHMRIRLRANQVRERYKIVIETLYRETAPLFLAHTNNVYIMNKNDVRTLIVYVDESIFSAELNAQRELVKLKMLELFGEQIEEFEIYVSRGQYKNHHPYVDPDVNMAQPFVPADLDSAEMDYVRTTATALEPAPLRSSFEKAMTAAMALNKTENGKTS